MCLFNTENNQWQVYKRDKRRDTDQILIFFNNKPIEETQIQKNQERVPKYGGNGQ